MELDKIFEYGMRAVEIGLVLGRKVPDAIADGKITLDEMVDLTKEICAVGGWKLEIELPEEFLGVELGVKRAE